MPGSQALRDLWREIEQEAVRQNRSVFQVSSLMAISAMKSVPEKARWLSASARSAARKTGMAVAAILLEDYRTSLKQIRETGYVRYAVEQYRPYLSAAVAQFSPRRQSLTERLISMAARRKASGNKRSRARRRTKKSSPSPTALVKSTTADKKGFRGAGTRPRRLQSRANLK